jgi:DNA-binding response OmpR family regulator
VAKLLIVDDSMDTREFCELVARVFNIEVEQALNADDGVKRLSRGLTPDLILLDLMMPGRSPEDFVRWVRGEERFKNTKVIVISALREVAQRAREMGANGALRKPFEMATFVDLLRRHAMDGACFGQMYA